MLLAENHMTWEKEKRKNNQKKTLTKNKQTNKKNQNPTQSHLENGQRKQEEFFSGQSKSAILSTV